MKNYKTTAAALAVAHSLGNCYVRYNHGTGRWHVYYR